MNKKCLLIVPVLFLFFLGVNQAWGHSGWEKNIPNGSINSCKNCHPTGTGPTNQFGKDFKSHNYVWGASLAAIDSDGDTFTNGIELQDPDGTWVNGQPAPGNSDLVTNPGDPASKPATTCSAWTDVIAKYTDYVSGQATWAEVIDCYTQYVAAQP
jgi:hypothetical protein